MNYYVLHRLVGFFSIEKNVWFYIVAIAGTLSYIITTTIEQNFPNVFTRMLHAVSSSWMGVLFFFFITLLIYEIVKYFIHLQPSVFGIIVLSIVSFLTIFSIANAMFFNVAESNVPIEGLSKDMIIVQLSDLHVGSIRNSGFLA